jgi:hypothetical protein
MAALSEQIKNLSDAGFSTNEVEEFKQEKIKTLTEAGFQPNEILKEFGLKELNLTPIRNAWQNILKVGREEHESVYAKLKELEIQGDDTPFIQKQKEALVGEIFEPAKYWQRGWGAGIYDLHQSYVHGDKMPELYTTEQPDDTGFLERNITNISRLVKDLPIYAVPTIAGAYLTKKPDLSLAAGAFVAGSLRETYLKALQNDEVNGFQEFWKIWTEEGIKAGGIEAAQIYAATKTGGLVKGGFKKTIAQATAFEGVGAILHGEMPSKEQMQDSVFLFGLFNFSGATIKKSKDIITKNDRTMTEFADDMIINKTVLEDAASTTNQNPRYYGGDKNVTLKPDTFKEGLKFKTEAEQKINDNIRFDEPEAIVTTKEKAEAVKDSFVKNSIDRLHPVKKLISRVQNTKNTKDALNVYEEFRTLLGVENLSGTFIEVGTQNAKLQTNGKSYKQVLEPLINKDFAVVGLPEKVGISRSARDLKNKQTVADFVNYAVSKRVLEKESQGIKTGFDLKAAKEVVNNKELIKKHDKTAKELTDYNRRLLEYARDKGLLTEEAFDAMIELNKDYIPFARVVESSVKDKGFIQGVSNPFKRMTGSTKQVIDPVATTYSNTFNIIKKVERNSALTSFFNLIEANKKSFPDINKKTITKSTKLNVKELEDLGINMKKFDNNTQAGKKLIDNLKVFRKEFDKVGDDSVAVFRNGKYEVWEVGKELADAMKDFNPRDASNLFIGIARHPARWLRAGATLAFDFVGANFLRDTVQAAIYSKYGFFPVVSSIRGLFDIVAGRTGLNKNSQKYYEYWLKSGGMQSTMLSVDRAVFDKPAFDILNKGPIRNKAENPIEILRVISETFENATRLSEFRRAYDASIKRGLTHEQAIKRGGFESRDVTLDFGRMGAKMRGLNQISAFYNAMVQGFDKIFNTYRQRPTRTTLVIGGAIIGPTALFWFLGKDDPAIQAQPEWVKRGYWLTTSGEGKNKVVHKIPVPFDVGVTFKALTESFLEKNYNKDAKTKKELDGWFTDYLLKVGKGFVPTPQFAMPFIEGGFNVSWFQGRPLVPHYIEKNLPNKMQYTTYTSETAKILANGIYKLIGTDTKFNNPIIIDNFARQWTGTIGRYLIQLSDKALIESGMIKDPILPTQPLSKMPVIRAFTAQYPDANSQYITDFYEEYNKISKIVNEIDALEKEGKVLEAVELRESVKGKNRLQLIPYADAIKDLNFIIRNVYNNKEYTPDEKRDLIDAHYLVMIKTAQRALENMNLKIESKD